MEREWPDEIKMTDVVKQLVTKRWAEYGFEKFFKTDND